MASIHSKKTKSGQTIYYVVVSSGGLKRWLKAGSLQAAKLLKKTVEAMSASERIAKFAVGTPDRRIDEFFQEFIDRVRLTASPNTVKRYRVVLNTFLVFLEMFHSRVRFLRQVSPEVIESYQNKRLKSIELKHRVEEGGRFARTAKRLPEPQTVNFEITVLRTALIDALNHGFLESVPTQKVRSLRVARIGETRILTPEECSSLLKAADALGKDCSRNRTLAHALRFLLNTGLRAGELCNLSWSDVDLDSGLLRIRPKTDWTPKTNSREFYMNESARSVLKRIGRDEGLIFKNGAGTRFSTDDLRMALIKAAKFAGIQGLTKVHSLRHTYNSLMQMAGVDVATMATILGHRNIKTTMIYTHQTQEHLKRVVEKVEI